MVYLSIDVGRWGLIKRGLPEPFKKSFNEFIRVLHIDFFYNGNYPKDKVDEEFRKWYEKVEKYINDLETRVKNELRGQAMK
jgi:hypothetical protein